MPNLLSLWLVLLICMGYILSNLHPPTIHYPLLFKNLVLWNSSDVVVGFCITSTYLSVYEKIFCYCLDEAFPEYSKLQASCQW